MPKKPASKPRTSPPRTSKVRTGLTLLVATRLPHDLVARLDALAGQLSLPGLPVTRAEATRAAITAGIAIVEQSTRGPARKAKPAR